MKDNCCKSCKFLGYYDGYFCTKREDVILDDKAFNIEEKNNCEIYEEREDVFWRYKDAEF